MSDHEPELDSILRQSILTTDSGQRNIVICTTSIISGNKMMEAAMEKSSFGRESIQVAGGAS